VVNLLFLLRHQPLNILLLQVAAAVQLAGVVQVVIEPLLDMR
jgi:hypothetical protein